MYFERKRMNLPNHVVDGNKIDIDWLKGASPEEQHEALFQWFTNQYEDPVESLPYDSDEGGYIPIHGALVDPFDEFWEFYGIVPDNVIEDVAKELFDIAGDMWSPIYHPSKDDYEFFSSPLEQFKIRVEKATRLLSSLSEEHENYFLLKISVFSLLVTAFETYLWEITKYNINNKNLNILPNLISESSKDDYFERSLTMKEIYKKRDAFDAIISGIEGRIINKLDKYIVWHNIDHISYVFKKGFGLRKLPSYRNINQLLETRHNIVHRFGMSYDGKEIKIPDINYVINAFNDYCQNMDKMINEKINENILDSLLIKEK